MPQLTKVLHTIYRGISKPKIGILGVPFSKGQRKNGVELGPKFIREAGLVKRISEIYENVDIKDFGDISYCLDNSIDFSHGNMKDFNHVGSCAKVVSASVESIIKEGRLCVNLGGDHSISVGTVDGHVKATDNRISVLWVDAHADLNTHKTSDSGNVHGMPVSLLAKELADYWPYLNGMDWQQPIFSVSNLAYIGLRSVDVYERKFIEKFGISAFGMEDIDKYGINTVLQMALDRIDPQQNRSLHVSYDIDSLDTLEAPSTGTSVRGGMTLREGLLVMEAAFNTGRLNCVDVVEVNPKIGTESDVNKTVDAALHLIAAACGGNRKGIRLHTVPEVEPEITYTKNN